MFGCVFPHGFPHAIEAGSVVVDKIVIDPAALDDDMEDAVHQGGVATGTDGDVQIGCAGKRRYPGIDHDQLRAPVPGAPDIVRGDRSALGDVGAGHQDDIRQGDIGPRVRRAVYPERLFVAGSGGNHAEAAVIVQILRLQRHPRELARKVGLLVAQRHSGEHGERVLAILFLYPPYFGDGTVQRLVPGRLLKTRFRPNKRMQQPVGMLVLHVTLHALGTELSLIERKIFPRLEADNLVVLDLQVNAALLAAKAAVRCYQFVGLALILPAAGRRPLRRRAELSN